jgi:hypothetical protein
MSGAAERFSRHQLSIVSTCASAVLALEKAAR